VISPYLNAVEAAQFLRFVKPDGAPDVRACLRFLKRHGVNGKKRGRVLLFRREDVSGVLVPTERKAS
jgi:hypothetical protein